MAVLTRVSDGFDGLREYLGDIAIAADQIFVKVPARHILRSRVGRPFVERMGIRPVYGGFGRDWKGNSIVALRGLRDLGRAVGFLWPEVARGDTDHHQAPAPKLRPQFVQSGVLRRETAQ